MCTSNFGSHSPIYQSTILPITFTHPGEIRVDITAIYTNASGELYMGALTWGGIVMTPDDQADLVAHGRRGLDSLSSIPGSPWYVFCRDLSIASSAVSHTFNPYFNGELLLRHRCLIEY